MKTPNTVLTPSQLDRLIAIARRRSVQAELCIRLSAQAGLRGEEIQRVTPAMFDPAVSQLHLKNQVTKTSCARLIPLQGKIVDLVKLNPLPATEVPLFGKIDSVALLASFAEEARVVVSFKALRKSYAAYRFAQTNDEDRVAHEMGFSRCVLRQNSISLVSAKEAAAWFSV